MEYDDGTVAMARADLRSSRAKVLLILPADVLDRARALAGKATATLKLPVSLQIVLRALIEEGLKRGDGPALLDNFDRQARAVRDIRRAARERSRSGRSAGAATRTAARTRRS